MPEPAATSRSGPLPEDIRASAGGPVFCTLSDSDHLPQTLALLASLERHAPGMGLWVLSLDTPCQILLAGLNKPGLGLLSREDLTRAAGPQATGGRSWEDERRSLRPILVGWVLEHDARAQSVIAIDTDCWLAGPVAPLLARFEASAGACMVTPISRGEPEGPVVAFRRGEDARAILQGWREQGLAPGDGGATVQPTSGQTDHGAGLRRWASRVFVLDRPELVLTPGTVARYWPRLRSHPCVYQVQGFRLFQLAGLMVIRASSGIAMGRDAISSLYYVYLNDMLVGLGALPAGSLRLTPVPLPQRDPWGYLLLLPRLLLLHWIIWIRPLPAALRS